MIQPGIVGILSDESRGGAVLHGQSPPSSSDSDREFSDGMGQGAGAGVVVVVDRAGGGSDEVVVDAADRRVWAGTGGSLVDPVVSVDPAAVDDVDVDPGSEDDDAVDVEPVVVEPGGAVVVVVEVVGDVVVVTGPVE